MNILEELKLSKKQNNNKRYDYLCQQFNAVDYAIKLEKYTIKLQQENKQLKKVIDKVKKFIHAMPCCDDYLDTILEILKEK